MCREIKMIKNRYSENLKELAKERMAIDMYGPLGEFEVKSGRRLEE